MTSRKNCPLLALLRRLTSLGGAATAADMRRRAPAGGSARCLRVGRAGRQMPRTRASRAVVADTSSDCEWCSFLVTVLIGGDLPRCQPALALKACSDATPAHALADCDISHTPLDARGTAVGRNHRLSDVSGARSSGSRESGLSLVSHLGTWLRASARQCKNGSRI